MCFHHTGLSTSHFSDRTYLVSKLELISWFKEVLENMVFKLSYNMTEKKRS